MAQSGLISRKSNTTEAVDSNGPGTKVSREHMMSTFSARRGISPPPGSLLCWNRPPFFLTPGVKPPWGTRFPFHTLQTGLSALGHITSSRKPSSHPGQYPHRPHTEACMTEVRSAASNTNLPRLRCWFQNVHTVWPGASDQPLWTSCSNYNSTSLIGLLRWHLKHLGTMPGT